MNPHLLKKFLSVPAMAVLTAFLAVISIILIFSPTYGLDETLNAFVSGLKYFEKIEKVAGIEASNQSLMISDISSNGDSAYTKLELENYQVKPLNIEVKSESALLTPTSGIAAHPAFIYHEDTHPGIDIWTSVNGKGLAGGSKGYPVYSACSGTIIRVFHPNEEIEIDCDMISVDYVNFLPSLDVKILYSHMGDGETKEGFHTLRLGQKVKRGELVGFQGNISSFVPENRVTHLHFGIYDMKTRKPLDPSPYIGFSSVRLGQTFSSLR